MSATLLALLLVFSHTTAIIIASQTLPCYRGDGYLKTSGFALSSQGTTKGSQIATVTCGNDVPAPNIYTYSVEEELVTKGNNSTANLKTLWTENDQFISNPLIFRELFVIYGVDQSAVYARNLTTGDIIWSFANDFANHGRLVVAPFADENSPSSEQRPRQYIGLLTETRLWIVNASDGNPVWHLKPSTLGFSFYARFTPIINERENLVVIAEKRNGESIGVVLVFNLKSGKNLWSQAVEHMDELSPATFAFDDMGIVFCTRTDGIAVYFAQSGQKVPGFNSAIRTVHKMHLVTVNNTHQGLVVIPTAETSMNGSYTLVVLKIAVTGLDSGMVIASSHALNVSVVTLANAISVVKKASSGGSGMALSPTTNSSILAIAYTDATTLDETPTTRQNHFALVDAGTLLPLPFGDFSWPQTGLVPSCHPIQLAAVGATHLAVLAQGDCTEPILHFYAIPPPTTSSPPTTAAPPTTAQPLTPSPPTLAPSARIFVCQPNGTVRNQNQLLFTVGRGGTVEIPNGCTVVNSHLTIIVPDEAKDVFDIPTVLISGAMLVNSTITCQGGNSTQLTAAEGVTVGAGCRFIMEKGTRVELPKLQWATSVPNPSQPQPTLGGVSLLSVNQTAFSSSSSVGAQEDAVFYVEYNAQSSISGGISVSHSTFDNCRIILNTPLSFSYSSKTPNTYCAAALRIDFDHIRASGTLVDLSTEGEEFNIRALAANPWDVKRLFAAPFFISSFIPMGDHASSSYLAVEDSTFVGVNYAGALFAPATAVPNSFTVQRCTMDLEGASVALYVIQQRREASTQRNDNGGSSSSPPVLISANTITVRQHPSPLQTVSNQQTTFAPLFAVMYLSFDVEGTCVSISHNRIVHLSQQSSTNKTTTNTKRPLSTVLFQQVSGVALQIVGNDFTLMNNATNDGSSILDFRSAVGSAVAIAFNTLRVFSSSNNTSTRGIQLGGMYRTQMDIANTNMMTMMVGSISNQIQAWIALSTVNSIIAPSYVQVRYSNFSGAIALFTGPRIYSQNGSKTETLYVPRDVFSVSCVLFNDQLVTLFTLPLLTAGGSLESSTRIQIVSSCSPSNRELTQYSMMVKSSVFTDVRWALGCTTSNNTAVTSVQFITTPSIPLQGGQVFSATLPGSFYGVVLSKATWVLGLKSELYFLTIESLASTDTFLSLNLTNFNLTQGGLVIVPQLRTGATITLNNFRISNAIAAIEFQRSVSRLSLRWTNGGASFFERGIRFMPLFNTEEEETADAWSLEDSSISLAGVNLVATSTTTVGYRATGGGVEMVEWKPFPTETEGANPFEFLCSRGAFSSFYAPSTRNTSIVFVQTALFSSLERGTASCIATVKDDPNPSIAEPFAVFSTVFLSGSDNCLLVDSSKVQCLSDREGLLPSTTPLATAGFTFGRYTVHSAALLNSFVNISHSAVEVVSSTPSGTIGALGIHLSALVNSTVAVDASRITVQNFGLFFPPPTPSPPDAPPTHTPSPTGSPSYERATLLKLGLLESSAVSISNSDLFGSLLNPWYGGGARCFTPSDGITDSDYLQIVNCEAKCSGAVTALAELQAWVPDYSRVVRWACNGDALSSFVSGSSSRSSTTATPTCPASVAPIPTRIVELSEVATCTALLDHLQPLLPPSPNSTPHPSTESPGTAHNSKGAPNDNKTAVVVGVAVGAAVFLFVCGCCALIIRRRRRRAVDRVAELLGHCPISEGGWRISHLEIRTDSPPDGANEANPYYRLVMSDGTYTIEARFMYRELPSEYSLEPTTVSQFTLQDNEMALAKLLQEKGRVIGEGAAANGSSAGATLGNQSGDFDGKSLSTANDVSPLGQPLVQSGGSFQRV